MRVNIATAVNAAEIREETSNGRVFIVVPSKTLPDNIVMNGGLYPASEIAKSFQTLEGSPAPLGHPEHEGEYISANDARAYLFNVGGFNRNVRRESGVVKLEKWIDKAHATLMAPELIAAIEAGEPIHTSTGLICTKVEASGDGYSWIARDMAFDHDAILIGEAGAATPDQGVGMMVNADRGVVESVLSASQADQREAISRALGDDAWLIDYDDERVIYEVATTGQKMAVDYAMSGAVVVFTGEAYEVTRKTLWARVAAKVAEVLNVGKKGQEMDKEAFDALKAAQEQTASKIGELAATVTAINEKLEAQAEAAEAAEVAALTNKRQQVAALFGDVVANGADGAALDALLAKAPHGEAAPIINSGETQKSDAFAGYGWGE